MNKVFRLSDEEIGYYSKSVVVNEYGSVSASVFAHAKDGHLLRRVGHKYIMAFFCESIKCIEKRSLKLHKWADEYIHLCQKQECQYQKVD